MANSLISGLPAASALSRADLLEVEQGIDPDNTSGQTNLGGVIDFIEQSWSAVTALDIVSGVVTLDYSLGKNWTITLDENVTSLVFSNLAGAGFVSEFELQITQDGTGDRTFALPASFKVLGGSDTAIASAAGAVTVLSAKTFDNGTTWRYAMQESA